MNFCDVCWVALNENSIPITQGSSFNICEHVQVSLKAEEPGAVSLKVALNWLFWMHFKVTGNVPVPDSFLTFKTRREPADVYL